MTHDPFQTYTTLGSYYGMPSPIGLPYNTSPQTSAINPALNPLLGLSQVAQAGVIPQVGQSPYGQNPVQGHINPQQLQLVSLLMSNPVLAASLLSNPLIAASLHSQALGSYGVPQFGLQQPSFIPQVVPQNGQMASPFGQVGYPLAPQSWIGQSFAPGHPFQQQWIPRPFQAQGLSPWGY